MYGAFESISGHISDSESSDGSAGESLRECDIRIVPDAKTSNKLSYTPSGSYEIYLTKSGAFIPVDDWPLATVKKITAYFTLSQQQHTGVVRKIQCYKTITNPHSIIIPRFGVYELRNILKKSYSVVSQIPEGLPCNPVYIGKLNSNQQVIAEYLLTHIYTNKRVECGSAGCILNLEAGQGKSYLAAYLISVFRVKTCIILHSTALLEQWEKVIYNSLGDSVTIGYYYGKKKLDGDVILQIVDSSALDAFKLSKSCIEYTPLQWYKRFGFVICDESHLYSNKTALRAFSRAACTYALGLSATPDENPAFDSAVYWSLGPVVNAIDIPGYSTTTESFNAVVHRIMYYGPPSHTKTILNEYTGSVSSAATINMIADDDARSSVVVNCCIKALSASHYTYVFADRREYLLRLRNMLQDARISVDICADDADYKRIVGGATAEEMESAEARSKVILTTYAYMGTGKSIVKMDALILATPRRSKMKQYINRIFRLGSDVSIKRQIWDICDMRTPLASQYFTRAAYYKSKNYSIDEEKINHADVHVYERRKPTIPVKHATQVEQDHQVEHSATSLALKEISDMQSIQSVQSMTDRLRSLCDSGKM